MSPPPRADAIMFFRRTSPFAERAPQRQRQRRRGPQRPKQRQRRRQRQRQRQRLMWRQGCPIALLTFVSEREVEVVAHEADPVACSDRGVSLRLRFGVVAQFLSVRIVFLFLLLKRHGRVVGVGDAACAVKVLVADCIEILLHDTAKRRELLGGEEEIQLLIFQKFVN